MNSVYERDLRLLQSKYDSLEAAYHALAESGRKLNQHINELQTDNAELRIENGSLRKDAVELIEYMTSRIFKHDEGGIVLKDFDGKDVAANWLPKAHKFIDAAMGKGK